MRLTVRVHPRASKAKLEWDGSKLAVWVHEPAADGAANEAVLRLIARWLGLAPSQVSLVRGHRAGVKIIEIGDAAPPPAHITKPWQA
jgi:uncharacterized protein YggU (UPF0235/DUF167 family)